MGSSLYREAGRRSFSVRPPGSRGAETSELVGGEANDAGDGERCTGQVGAVVDGVAGPRLGAVGQICTFTAPFIDTTAGVMAARVVSGTFLHRSREGWPGEWPRRWQRRRRSEPGDEDAVLAPYNCWVNPALTSAARPPDLPAGLTVNEAVRISEAITAAHAESTRTVYDFGWSQWERWCSTRGATPLPAEPALICAYLTEPARLRLRDAAL